MVQIRTLCFERVPGGTDRLAVLNPDKSATEIKFPESYPSPPAKVFLNKGKVIFNDPKDLTGPAVAIATVPAGMKNGLVMCFPSGAKEGEPPYRTVVVDISLKGIPKDGALVMSVFPEDVRVVIGEHRILLKPGKSAGLKRPQKRNDYNMAPVVFQAQEGAEWKTAAETLVSFPPDLRQFFVSFPDFRTNKLRFRSYQIDEF